MDRMCDLPVHVLSNLLVDWLDLPSVLSLDSASCSAASRNVYLEVVGGSGFCFHASCVRFLRANGMKWFVNRNAKIDRVWIEGFRGTDVGLTAAFLHVGGVRLKSFSIFNCHDGKMLTAVIGHLSTVCCRLEVLQIHAYDVVADSTALGMLLSSCAPSLTCLAVASLETVQCSQLPGLQMLQLNRCTASADALCRIVSACPNLRRFHCDNLQGSDAALDALAASCPHLQVLNYERGSTIDFSSLIRLLQSCSDIQVVDISTDGGCSNPSARDAQIAAIMQHCNKLQAFAAGTDWGTAAGLSDAAGLAVATRVQDLRHLRLLGCNFTTDAPLMALAQNCQDLRSLDLSWSHASPHIVLLRGTAPVELVKNLRSVKELRFSYCGVYDPVLEGIAANCSQLQRLGLPWCGEYTERGLLALACGCTALKSLCIDQRDENFSPLAQLLWQTLRPGMRFSYVSEYHSFLDSLRDINSTDLVAW